MAAEGFVPQSIIFAILPPGHRVRRSFEQLEWTYATRLSIKNAAPLRRQVALLSSLISSIASLVLPAAASHRLDFLQEKADGYSHPLSASVDACTVDASVTMTRQVVVSL